MSEVNLNDPAVKAAIKESVEAAQAAAAESEAALKEKNAELLAEAKKAKAELRKVQDISPEDFAALESERDQLAADLKAAQKEVTDAAKASEKVAAAMEAESAFTRKLLIENGVKDALIKGGVKDEDFIDALATKFAAGATVVAEGDIRKAMRGDKELSEAVTEYLESDAGKKFKAAPANGGGGAPGGGGNTGGKTVTREQFNAMDQGSRAAFIADGGKPVHKSA